MGDSQSFLHDARHQKVGNDLFWSQTKREHCSHSQRIRNWFTQSMCWLTTFMKVFIWHFLSSRASCSSVTESTSILNQSPRLNHQRKPIFKQRYNRRVKTLGNWPLSFWITLRTKCMNSSSNVATNVLVSSHNASVIRHWRETSRSSICVSKSNRSRSMFISDLFSRRTKSKSKDQCQTGLHQWCGESQSCSNTITKGRCLHVFRCRRK